ncbi:PLD nuclease N-terminal domain-containing protein [Enterocloster sp.]|uniref:PLD nuclease N-terminal domain-containing protein n=1 Tax=Enterocloster sp. TaxID=2719315 RepID=UPI0039BD1B7F
MRHRDFSKKIVWVLIVLFASGIMALLYFEDLEQKHNEAYLFRSYGTTEAGTRSGGGRTENETDC